LQSDDPGDDQRDGMAVVDEIDAAVFVQVGVDASADSGGVDPGASVPRSSSELARTTQVPRTPPPRPR
jgi:hypothetical protein